MPRKKIFADEELKQRARERAKKYNSQPDTKVRKLEWQSKPENKEKLKEWRLKNKEILKEKKRTYSLEYEQRPEVIARRKAIQSTHEYKEKKKAYHSKPENKEKFKEWRERPENKQRAREHRKKPITIERQEARRQKKLEIMFQTLGNRCISCGEKYVFHKERGFNLKRSNLEFHHKFYSEEDKERLKKGLPTKHFTEIWRFIKQDKIDELKEKFTLLCDQCNIIEAFVRKDKVKAYDTFRWLYGQGYFDEALKDDPSLKKLSEFMD